MKPSMFPDLARNSELATIIFPLDILKYVFVELPIIFIISIMALPSKFRFSERSFMFPSHQNYSIENRKSQSERIKVRLSSHLVPAVKIIVFTLREHIIDDSDRQQVQLGQCQTELFASQQEQGRCHRAVSFAMFF